jgi:hypothetical protein
VHDFRCPHLPCKLRIRKANEVVSTLFANNPPEVVYGTGTSASSAALNQSNSRTARHRTHFKARGKLMNSSMPSRCCRLPF